MLTILEDDLITVVPDTSDSQILQTQAESEVEIEATFTPLPPEKPDPKPLCGGPEVMTILAIGVDTFDDEYFYGLADVI